jgi:serine/threonine protein kinase
MGYMSPEQVRGKPRTAGATLLLRAILYEMLSGQRAFRGDTAADTITAILTKEPPDLTQTNKDLHSGSRRIVRHCLEKNPEERFESARDVAFDLEALSGVSKPTGAHALPEAAKKRSVLVPVLLGAALALAAGLAAGYRYGKKAGTFPLPTISSSPFAAARCIPRGSRRTDRASCTRPPGTASRSSSSRREPTAPSPGHSA